METGHFPQAQGAGKIDSGYVLGMPANLHGFPERKLPDNTGAVTARLWQDGQDEAQQWGPGIAVIWPDGTALRTNIRKASPRDFTEAGKPGFNRIGWIRLHQAHQLSFGFFKDHSPAIASVGWRSFPLVRVMTRGLRRDGWLFCGKARPGWFALGKQ